MVKTILLKFDDDKHEELKRMKGDKSWEKFVEELLKDWQALHINIHAIRLIKNYKPTEFELNTGKRVIETFKNTCEECAKVSERLKTQTGEIKKKSFWEALIGG